MDSKRIIKITRVTKDYEIVDFADGDLGTYWRVHYHFWVQVQNSGAGNVSNLKIRLCAIFDGEQVGSGTVAMEPLSGDCSKTRHIWWIGGTVGIGERPSKPKGNLTAVVGLYYDNVLIDQKTSMWID